MNWRRNYRPCFLQIALSNPPKNWTRVIWICWTNLKPLAIVGFPWPIYIKGEVYISCLNRIRWINWYYCVFVQVRHNRSAHYCIFNHYFFFELWRPALCWRHISAILIYFGDRMGVAIILFLQFRQSQVFHLLILTEHTILPILFETETIHRMQYHEMI